LSGAALGSTRLAWLAVAALCSCFTVPRASASSTPTRPDCLSRDLGGGLFLARGSVFLPTSPDSAFAILVDYEALPRFVSAMDSSRVVRRDSVAAIVRQVGTAALIVPRRVWIELRFEPTPPQLLRFEIARGDFPVYYGSWKFEPAVPGTRLVYTLTMKPPGFVPQWLVRPYVERILCRTLREVRDECMRRASD
jgi:ribosome-associated toxin RatA of RatAB toxin-antitoxin module